MEDKENKTEGEVGSNDLLSLGDCPTGEQRAIIPHFSDRPIRVRVDEWTKDPFGTPMKERLVYFIHGTHKEALTSHELKGALFLR